MSYKITTAEERKELITLMVNIFGDSRKTFSKRKNNQLLNKLRKAHFHPDQIKEDLESFAAPAEGSKEEHHDKIHILINNYILCCMQWSDAQLKEMNNRINIAGGTEGREILPEPKDNGNIKIKDSDKPSKIIKDLVSAGVYTWNEITRKATELGVKQTTIQQYKSDFKNLKYSPKNKAMATRGDGKVCWI